MKTWETGREAADRRGAKVMNAVMDGPHTQRRQNLPVAKTDLIMKRRGWRPAHTHEGAQSCLRKEDLRGCYMEGRRS